MNMNLNTNHNKNCIKMILQADFRKEKENTIQYKMPYTNLSTRIITCSSPPCLLWIFKPHSYHLHRFFPQTTTFSKAQTALST